MNSQLSVKIQKKCWFEGNHCILQTKQDQWYQLSCIQMILLHTNMLYRLNLNGEIQFILTKVV